MSRDTGSPKSERIELLLDAMRRRFGAGAIRSYGDSLEPDDTGFTVDGVPAMFSVIVLPETPPDRYDIQVESLPPGDYLYTAVVDLASFEALAARIASTPMDQWPRNAR